MGGSALFKIATADEESKPIFGSYSVFTEHTFYWY